MTLKSEELTVEQIQNSREVIWENLDNASGNLYNALEAIYLEGTVGKDILKEAERIDVEAIVNLKNLVGELLGK